MTFTKCNVQIGENCRIIVNQLGDDTIDHDVSSVEDSDASADNATNDSTGITDINSERTGPSDKDSSGVQDNYDGSDASIKKTDKRDDCTKTNRLLPVILATFVAVTGVVIVIKLQRV